MGEKLDPEKKNEKEQNENRSDIERNNGHL